MRTSLAHWAFFTSAVLLACGSSVDSVEGAGASGAGAAGSTTSSGAAGSPTTSSGPGGAPNGECETDAQCPGGKCIELTPGGYKVCGYFPPEATGCAMPPDPTDQCCTSSDCVAGACFKSTDLPYCGGPAMAEYNLCMSDQCQTDDDCIHDNPDPWICYPSGAFGFPARMCSVGYCHTNADCTTAPGGACVPIEDSCCSLPYGLACVYPGGCSKDSDCSAGSPQHCGIDEATGTGVCEPGDVDCPV